MKKNDFKKIIRNCIYQAAAQKMRENSKLPPSKGTAVDLTEDEFDDYYFNGAGSRIKRHFGLNENEQRVTVTQTEIDQFEKSMIDAVNSVPNAYIRFDKQENGNYLMLKNNEQGINVHASGNIEMGNEGSFKWIYSIPNGFKIQADGFEITPDNVHLFQDLSNNFDTFQKEWRQRMSYPEGAEEDGSLPDANDAAGQPSGMSNMNSDQGVVGGGGPTTPDPSLGNMGATPAGAGGV